MADIMIDLEGLGTGPSATILTIGAQMFDPMSRGWHDRHYYARITLESQPDRNIEQGTIEWWATQPEKSREEAFGEDNRVPLDQALDELGRLIWQANYVWANGPTYDMNILEHAYKSYNKPLPWKYYRVRDARTIYSLYPDLPKYPATHHALEDCQRQIYLLQDTFKHLNIREMR